ncbi:MAG: UvrD-helicase domain-containing protein, partial [Lachnospiraceae bacterium]
MTVWTAEQTSAIALRHRRLLVSAAAGSGKTAVLTERIVQRISDPAEAVDIDELLIMTFTRAAAAEMRERIRKKLSVRLSGGEAEVSPGVKQRLKKQVALLELA